MTPFLNLAPETFVEGGLIDDINATITDAKFTMYDYNGKSENGPVPALGIELELEDGTKHESYYSAGDAKYWAPSQDGKQLVPTGDKTSLTKSCKLAIFLTALINAGFSVDKLRSGDISIIVGLKAHFQRVADKERKGLVRTKEQEDRGQQSTLVVTKIIAMPGEAPKAAAAPKAMVGAPAAATQSASAAPSASVDDDAVLALLFGEVLPANGGSIAKTRVSQAVFKIVTKDHPLFAQRTAVTQRAMNDALLKAGAEAGMFAYDGTTVTAV